MAYKNDPNKSFLQNLYSQLAGSADPEWTLSRLGKYVPNSVESMNNIADILDNPNMSDATKAAAQGASERITEKLMGVQDAFATNPFKTKVDLGDGITGNSLKHTLGMIGSNVKTHPYLSAGIGAMGAANIAGLVDDNKIGGQLVGGLAGGVIPAMMGANPMTAIALGLGGGTLGSLFDKLRAKKEAEQQTMYQQQEY